MAQIAIETSDLRRVFTPRVRFFGSRQGQDATALRGVSMQVKVGERVALVGPNGAGKSTLLRILATLLSPTGGTASVAGYDVERQRRQVRASIGHMSGDDRSFFWPLTAVENLRFFASLQGYEGGRAQELVREMVSGVGLDPDDGRPVSAFSSGMRQRLGLARALLHDPPILLLDEPTANLDAASRERLVETIRTLSSASQRTVLFATHDAQLVAEIADRVVNLAAGRVISAEDDRRPRCYRLLVRSQGGDDASSAVSHAVEMTIDDLGDGHALGAAIQRVIADGGEILEVQPCTSVETLP